ncbi:hypothetical protein PBI_SCTP2_239 [Salicola phage SCTP-2]|nr:hypothetical protein PBI_SCTP2_239 [Salicola phage SCTP-2]
MSESIRQNNLFAAEDWKVIYNAFRNVNLQAYDYESIYNALIEYLKTNNPDEFNDYVQHSEMIAHINMLAYLGQSYAFRIDLNARENFFDTAQRRESVIKLAQGLSYKPKRNRAAQGLCKITSISTTEPVSDSNGNSLAGKEIVWNQINNANWFENFIRVLNRSFISINRYGEPIKNDTISGISTEIYAINEFNNSPIVYSFDASVNGQNYNFEVTGADIKNSVITEQEPNPESYFNLIYKNDGHGNNSENNGFFLYFKQGSLRYNDYQYTEPKPDRELTINENNINENDVWLQEINNDGTIKKSWKQIPSIVGQNIVYNNIVLDERNVYAVNTLKNNQINLKFSDGNFGNVPLGLYRVWYRISENESYIIRPNHITDKTITIPYIGIDNERYNLTLKFSLEYTIDNAESEESIDEIKRNAPLSYYTQDRMINGEDYNIYPITQSNVIRKIKSVNRTHAGYSRYIDITDPTGSHSNITVIGEDGYIFKDNFFKTLSQRIESNTNYDAIIKSKIEPLLKDYGFENFYYHDVRQTILSDELDNLGGYGSDYFQYEQERYVWKSLPKNDYNNTGYIVDTFSGENIPIGESSGDDKQKLIRENTKILFMNNYGEEKWTTILNVTDNGLVNLRFMTVGNIELSDNIQDDWYIKEVIPGIRKVFNNSERLKIEQQMKNNRSFGLRFDFVNNDWVIIEQDNIGEKQNREDYNLLAPNSPNDVDNRWLMRAFYNNDQGTKKYYFEFRSLRYIFGSDKEVRFFFKNSGNIIDYETGKLVKDYISILSSNTDRKNVNNSTKKGRAVLAHMYTSPTHNSNTEYDITNIVPYNTNYGNVRLYTVGRKLIKNWFIRFENNRTYLSINDNLIPDNTTTPFKITDIVDVFDFEQEDTKLKRSYDFELNDYFIKQDGIVDYSKIHVKPYVNEYDNIPEYPLAFEDIVDLNSYIFFKSYKDFDNIIYDRIDNNIKVLNDNTTRIEPNVVYYCNNDIEINNINGDKIYYEEGKFYKGDENTNDGLRKNSATELVNNKDNDGNTYSAYIGRSFTENDPMIFKWRHYASSDQRIDISIGNIIDMYVLTRSYDTAVRLWLKNREDIAYFPEVPTSNEIKNNLGFIEKNKSTSDQIIYVPAQYKLLFGEEAEPEYQATFKVIRLPGSNLTDNEIKSRIIDAINEYFNIDNWDFGSGFYYTELSSFIHTQLVGEIKSVVIVPRMDESRFGELFEIRSEPNELFLSTAKVDNVEIVKTYTDHNIRK